MKQQTPIPPKSRMKPRKSQKVPFSHSWFGGGRGYKFSIYFVQDCSAFKYLGITLSEDLSGADHIKNIMSKTNQRLGLIRRIKRLLPLHARLTLYRSLILPLSDYGDIIWGDKTNTTLMNYLQIQQNKAAKILLDKANILPRQMLLRS